MLSGTEKSSLTATVEFLRGRWLLVLSASVLLLVPCFWHRRIEAGDLGSHVYNAWLAQLIERGQAPGLYISKQWNNVLFDLMLLKLGNLFGLAMAERLAVSGCVLIFFWGAFALLSAVTQRAHWSLLPCLAMLAYGWTFNVGFFNYYLSLGLGFFVTAMAWRRIFPKAAGFAETANSAAPAAAWGGEVVVGLILAALVFAAHPQGFAWLVGCGSYIVLWRMLPGWWKLALPLAAAGLFVAVRVYCLRHFEMWSVWDSFGPGIYNGSDQIVLYSKGYLVLSGVALLFGIACFVLDSIRRRRTPQSWRALRLPLELYGILVFATYVLPDALRVPLYSGWIGAMAIRLTTLSAAIGLSVLGFMQPRKWHAIGFGAIAAVFFAFLYRDTGVLNHMEQQVERLVSTLPPGQRVLATIWAPPDSRLPFIMHITDRACIGRCFSFENYEPASGEFRVRVQRGSPVVSADTDEREAMEAGEYLVKPEDLPVWQIYQCDEKDLGKLCIRQLAAGEANGRLGYHPPTK